MNQDQSTILDAALSNLIFAVLEPHRFVQSENRFIKSFPDITWLITLQKSCCSTVHNLNMAVIINRLLPQSDAEVKWGHIQTRLCLLADSELMLALDSMEPMPYAQRELIISSAITAFGLPWLEQLASLDKIGQALKSGLINAKHHPLGPEDFGFLLG